MLISQKHKFIFVHVHKTAGMSFEQLLIQNFDDCIKWGGRHGFAVNGIQEIGREKWDSYLSFAFVRNPWDRLVSWYTMIQREKKRLPFYQQLFLSKIEKPFKVEIWNYAIKNSHDFESFLENCTEVIFDYDCYKSFAYNQIDYLCDEKGNLAVDFVGRFENLREDTQTLFKKLGISYLSLPITNKSKHSDYREWYTPTTKNLVAERFRRDIELFDYKF